MNLAVGFDRLVPIVVVTVNEDRQVLLFFVSGGVQNERETIGRLYKSFLELLKREPRPVVQFSQLATRARPVVQLFQARLATFGDAVPSKL